MSSVHNDNDHDGDYDHNNHDDHDDAALARLLHHLRTIFT